MALDNFANLRQYVKKMVHRDDLDEFIDDFIKQAEQEMFYGISPFRIPEMITESVAPESSKAIAFPVDFLELIAFDIEIDDCYHRLRVVPKNLLPDNSKDQGTPSAYSVTSQFELNVEPDKAYNFKFTYYQKPAALSDANPTNIILTKYPNAYVFGAMSVAFMYAGEEDKASQYALRMRDVIASANTDANNAMYGDMPEQIIDGSFGGPAHPYHWRGA